MDGGAILLEFIRHGRPSPFRDTLRRGGGSSVLAVIPRSEFRKLSVDLITQFAWLAEELKDSKFLEAVSRLRKEISGFASLEEVSASLALGEKS